MVYCWKVTLDAFAPLTPLQAVCLAGKHALLLPGDLEAQLGYGLLLYAHGRYEDAWLELGMVQEACGYPVQAGSSALAPLPGASGRSQDSDASSGCGTPASVAGKAGSDDGGTSIEGPSLAKEIDAPSSPGDASDEAATVLEAPQSNKPQEREDSRSSIEATAFQKSRDSFSTVELQRLSLLLGKLRLEMTIQ